MRELAFEEIKGSKAVTLAEISGVFIRMLIGMELQLGEQ